MALCCEIGVSLWDSSHPWKMLLSSLVFLSCLCNLMPKILTALDALRVAAMDRADLLIIVGEKTGCAFRPPKKKYLEYFTETCWERQSCLLAVTQESTYCKRNSCFVVLSSANDGPNPTLGPLSGGAALLMQYWKISVHWVKQSKTLNFNIHRETNWI